MATVHDDRLLLGLRDAAKMLSICERTLWGMTWPRGSIKSVRIGSRILYSVDGLRRWIDAQTAMAEGRSEG